LYRYNFDIDCQGYLDSVAICDELIKELIEFEGVTDVTQNQLGN